MTIDDHGMSEGQVAVLENHARAREGRGFGRVASSSFNTANFTFIKCYCPTQLDFVIFPLD